MTKIKSKAKFNERFNINTKNLKDEERLPKMYEHVGKAYIHRSKRSDEWRIAISYDHHNKEQRTKNKDDRDVEAKEAKRRQATYDDK